MKKNRALVAAVASVALAGMLSGCSNQKLYGAPSVPDDSEETVTEETAAAEAQPDKDTREDLQKG